MTRADPFVTEISSRLADLFGARTFFDADFDERLDADRALAAAGLLGYHWPTEYGGAGGTVQQTAALEALLAAIGLPTALSPSRFGVNLLGPALITHGSDEQKSTFLPRILAVQDIWCQGFSEPDAGSDLAAVATTATVQSDGQLVVRGSKTWTTQAHRADMCFALVRTGDPALRHRSLSMVFLPLHATGVQIQPIRQNTGRTEFNTIFFDDVLVPRTHLLGELGQGWNVAHTMLDHERSYGQSARYGYYIRELAQAFAELAEVELDEAQSIEHRLALAESADQLFAIQALSDLVLDASEGGEELGTLPSAVKYWWSTSHQHLLDTRMQIAFRGHSDATRRGEQWLASRAETIYAGASEIQLNIVAERKWGLPR
ncbi:acyl-CoA dehydrogenase family protein [Rhizomonospora bruguierae]|uniref:acyl-CoA dehydrogenase family protein n=1 Tax=Rhizomonospora bruguierae TaxID=1581705 RepID=UPI001BCE93EE|nr:acyl-CoA dehydrogenase family protein [Micromonospora sp. NBRC 107566]